jgi:transposase
MDRICKLIESDDYTVSEICKQVKLSESTYYDWKASNTEFSDAIKKAEERRLDTFKAAARSGLLTLLKGKEWEEVTTEYTEETSKDGKAKGKPKIKSMRRVKKFIMPNPTSVIFALKNLDDENFSDLIKTEHSGGIGGSFLHFLKGTSTQSTPEPPKE